MFFSFAIFIFGCKKNIDSTDNPAIPNDSAQVVITEKGVAIGDAVTANIGPEGGTISAADGGAILVIPRGALSTNTVISIQPVTNTLPQGLGDRAYQFMPEGLTFAIPAKLTLVYDTAENQGPSSAGLVIANQEQDGSWMHDAEVTADESRFSLTADMGHFSSWIVAKAISIVPVRSTVEPGKSVPFAVRVMEKYIPVAIAGRKRKKEIIRMVGFSEWSKGSAAGYNISGWRLNYLNAPGAPNDGILTSGSSRIFANYVAPSTLPPVRNPVLIQVVVSNNVNAPNMIGSAVVFVRKNGYLKATIGGQVYNYVQHIGEPSSSPGVVSASVLPLAGGSKLLVNAFNLQNGRSVGFLFFAKKGTGKLVYVRDSEQIAVSTSAIKSWLQEYYTRENGNGTTRCNEFGPKYSELIYTLTEFDGGLESWVSGTITGILYSDTDANRRSCQSSDAISIKIEFVLKSGS